MSRICGLVLLMASLAASAAERASAENTPERPTSAMPADVQDFVLLGPMRPLVIRLRVTIDGVPFRQVWQERFDELVGLEDRDRDGRVTLEQAETIARDMNGSLADPRSGDTKSPPLKSLAGPDGLIDRAALLTWVERVLPPFSLRQRAVVDRMSGLALFPLLDLDHDHQLSAEELAAAETQARQRDFDDNRLITRRELILDGAAIAAAADPASAEAALNPDDSPVVLVNTTLSSAQLADKLVARYDRNRDGKLSLAVPGREVLLGAEAQARLDADHDNALSHDELTKFLCAEADIELPLAMGQANPRDQRARPRVADREFRVRKTLQNGYDMKLVEAEVKLFRNNRNPQEADEANFRTLDADKNEYLDANEARNNNIGPSAFAAMDIDGDGKVFKGEFTSFMGRQTAAAAVRLQLEVSDEGQSLFEMLDTDNNGVLSPRELRTAASVLATADKNGDGRLAGDEVPQRIRLEVVRGVDAPPDARAVPVTAAMSTAKASSAGPTWFRKMDRNNDGDLSPHEFVGPLEAFEALDTDHDGFIDRQEAEAAKP